jgi:DUF4097 and DUF4098 domain-containing protein YvlB
MRVNMMVPALAAGLLVLSGCELEDWGASGHGRVTKDFHYSYDLKADGRVSLESFNGQVEISTWDQNTVDISGTKYAPTDDALEALKIDIQHSSDSVSIRAVRPSSIRGNTGAKFVVKVPRGAQLERVISSNGGIRTIDTNGSARLKTSNGTVRVQNQKGNLDVSTSNGGVELQDVEGATTVRTSNGRVRADGIRGSFEATTSNGGIHATLAKVEAGRTVRLETSNGGVELTLPADLRSDVRVSTNNSGITVHAPSGLNARVSARTSNSSIHSDFEMKTQGELSKHHLEGTIGSGGSLLDLSTSNGSIKLGKL